MSNPLRVIIDGFTAAGAHWQSLLGILLILIISQFILYSALKRIFGDKFSPEEYYALSISGWTLPVTLISLIWYLLGKILSPQISLLITIILISVAAFAASDRIPKTTSHSSKLTAYSLILLTGLFIFLRLAFVAKAVLPMYFDSAQHYLFARNILASLDHPGGIWPLPSYYHLGFHFLTAFITSVTGAQINDNMLILGQVLLATMPFSAFFIVRHWTQSNTAAIFAVFLTAFGWYMPAHAVDWGKYPALASVALIPFVLSTACLSIQNRGSLSVQKSLSLNAIVLMGMLVSIILHSRALIVFIIVALAWIVTTLWQRMRKPFQLFALCITLLVLAAEIAFIQTKGTLSPLFDAYGAKGVLITSSLLFLSFFAYLVYPRLVSFCIVSVSLLLICLFIPLGNLMLGYANMTLLDRPFIQMILYLPLTLLGGFGLAGLEQKLQGEKITGGNLKIMLGKLTGVFFITLVIVNALFKYDLYPADCCAIASHDDLDAIAWMDKNLPGDARILTSSTELVVLPSDAYQGSAGGDAGTWINPLIDRTTLLMPFNTDFSQQEILGVICQLQADYVYVGETGTAFDDSGMDVQPEGYKLLFSLPKAKVYQVTGCE